MSGGVISSFRGEYAFLSNFYFADMEFAGDGVSTVEHLYQAAKSTTVSDWFAILAATTPGKAKRLGRNICVRSDWDSVKAAVMKVCIDLKFDQNIDLASRLLDTGDALLEEGNYWHDNYWGNCTCKKCESIVGQNTLGQLLMKKRHEVSMRL